MVTYQPLLYLHQFCSEQLELYSYQNYAEVLILSFLVYKTILWLHKDSTKNLALYAYSYMGLLIASYAAQAYVLFWILFFLSPLIMLAFIIIHQHNIQRFFTQERLEKIDAQAMPANNWPALMIRSMLFAAHHKKHIFCIIQRNDIIAHLIQTPYLLNVAIQPDVTDFIVSSTQLENPTVMVISQAGIIKSLNITWSEKMHNRILVDHNHDTLQHNMQASAALAQATDAFVWYIDPTLQQATLWHQDTVIQNVSAQKLLTICQKLLQKEDPQSLGDIYVSKSNSDHTTSTRP
ncbi:hypothetical protein KBD08_01670 [Candidatus Babeliales bacterium]|nr:hypothetical protein [Candidatus Babeliales bacterium]